MLERDYDAFRAYRQAKLAQIMFTSDLANQLASKGVKVTVKRVPPGVADEHEDGVRELRLHDSTVEDGAAAILYVATPISML